MSDMLIDVDNAMRTHQMRAAWARYGAMLVSIILIALLAVAAGFLWHKRMNQAFTEQSTELMRILRDEAEVADTTQKLVSLSKKSDLPLQAIVALYHAQKLEQKNDLKGTQAVYAKIMAQPGVPEILTNLARAHYARLGVIQNEDADMLYRTLAPVLRTPQSAFYATGMELKGLILLREGKTAEANTVFTALSTDSTVPGPLRQRAKSMIRYE